MGSLWQFFGLPDPEGKPPENRPPPQPSAQQPVSLSNTTTAEQPVQSEVKLQEETNRATLNIRALRTPPLGWNGPLTPDGEAFGGHLSCLHIFESHDLSETIFALQGADSVIGTFAACALLEDQELAGEEVFREIVERLGAELGKEDHIFGRGELFGEFGQE